MASSHHLKAPNLVHTAHHVTPNRTPKPPAPLLHPDLGGGWSLGRVLHAVLLEVGPVLVPPAHIAGPLLPEAADQPECSVGLLGTSYGDPASKCREAGEVWHVATLLRGAVK